MAVMGAVNLPVDWSIPDPLRKAPLAGGWKCRKNTIIYAFMCLHLRAEMHWSICREKLKAKTELLAVSIYSSVVIQLKTMFF